LHRFIFLDLRRGIRTGKGREAKVFPAGGTIGGILAYSNFPENNTFKAKWDSKTLA